jgi:hypothetical protein
MRRRLRGRFALGFAVAAACATVAALVWAGALVASWQHDCLAPDHTKSAVQKPMSLWPPGVKCLETQGSKAHGSGGTYVHEALPFAPVVIAALGAFAAVALLAGSVAGLRDRRRRQADPPPVPGVP